MKGSIIAGLATALAAGSVSALPINDNGTAAYNAGDVNILNFALTLEYLEENLYETVVNTYSSQDFQNAGFKQADRDTFLQIIDQEQHHIAFLQSQVKMLGGQVIQPCKYNYGPVTSLNQLLNVTDAVNGLGPSAYLGAGAFIQSKLVLTAGSSLGNIESRHNSWLNGLLGRSEQPSPYQLPLSPTQSYGVAQQFIVDGSCPSSNANLLGAVTAYLPTLPVTNAGYPAKPLTAGATLMLQEPSGVNAPRVAFIYGFNTTIVDFSSSGVKIPSDAQGQSYAVLTTAYQGETLSDKNSLTAPAAFYVDVNAQRFDGLEFSTYDFIPDAQNAQYPPGSTGGSQ